MKPHMIVYSVCLYGLPLPHIGRFANDRLSLRAEGLEDGLTCVEKRRPSNLLAIVTIFDFLGIPLCFMLAISNVLAIHVVMKHSHLFTCRSPSDWNYQAYNTQHYQLMC